MHGVLLCAAVDNTDNALVFKLSAYNEHIGRGSGELGIAAQERLAGIAYESELGVIIM